VDAAAEQFVFGMGDAAVTGATMGTEPDAGTATAEELTFAFGIPTKLGAGDVFGSFTLCWGFNPYSLDDYSVEVGGAGQSVVTIHGPNAEPTPIACTLGFACSLPLTGLGFSNASKVAVVNGTCGVNAVAAVLTTEDEGTSATYAGTPLGGAGASVSLCWGPSPSLDNISSAFSVEVGTVAMTGPVFPTFDCTLGEPCTYELSGYNLATTNKLVIVEGSCGDDNAASFGASAGPLNGGTTNYEFSGLADASAGFPDGAEYSVCWGHEPDTDVTAHLVPVPGAILRGPYVQDFECAVGDPCNFVLRGLGLQTSNRLFLHKSNSQCGSAAYPFCTVRGLSDCTEVPPTISNGGKVATFELGTADNKGQPNSMMLCWTSAPESGDKAGYKEITIEVDANAEFVNR
jgi:hypothetical protein